MNIFITGSESTGKSTLSKKLSKHYNAPYVKEFARYYVGNLDREYKFEDVEFIARKQIEEIKSKSSIPLVFFDTGLIITNSWFELKYGKVPPWFQNSIAEYAQGKYILCSPDLPWEDDPVRENPHRRNELSDLYYSRILSMGYEVEVLKGQGENRLTKAIEIVDNWLA